jgi:hypothetical protein
MAQKLNFSPLCTPQQVTTPRYSHELPILTAGANGPPLRLLDLLTSLLANLKVKQQWKYNSPSYVLPAN